MAFVKLCLEATFAKTCGDSSVVRRCSVAFVIMCALHY